MRIPSFAQPITTYRETGEFPNPGERKEFSTEEAQRNLDRQLDSFKSWQSLDEGPHDLLKGRPGEVKLAGTNMMEFTEASFIGSPSNGELLIHENIPSRRYGAATVTYSKFEQDSVDTVRALNNNGYISSSHVHVDYQLASSGPIELGGSDPVTVTLTPRAQNGHWVREHQS